MELTRKQIRRGIIFSVSVSVVAIVIVLVLTQNDFSYKTFARIKSAYLLLAFLFTLIFWLLKALKLKTLIIGLGGNISFYKVFKIYLASAFVSHVTPSSSGGLPFQIYFMHREGLPIGKTTALTVLDNMLTFIFLMIVTPVFFLFWGEYLDPGRIIIKFFYLAAALGIIFIIVSLILIFNTHLANQFINWLSNLSLVKKFFPADRLKRFRDYLAREITYFNEGIKILVRGEKKNLFLVIFYTMFYWIFFLSLAPVLLKGLGISFTIPSVILAQLIFNFIQPVIPTPGGSGGAELSFAYLFKFMVPGYLLGVFVALWRFFMFYTSLIVGGIYFIHLVKGTDYLD